MHTAVALSSIQLLARGTGPQNDNPLCAKLYGKKNSTEKVVAALFPGDDTRI